MALIFRFQLWRDTHGQDLVEYALIAALVAVAAGATIPPVTASFSTIFSRVGSHLKIASTQGS